MEKIFSKDEDSQAMRWSKIKDKDSGEIFEIIGQKVFPFIKSLNGNNGSEFSR